MTGAGAIGTLRAAWRGLVGGGAILLVIVSWIAVRTNRDLAVSNAVFLKAKAYPYPLTSLRLETPETRLVDGWEPASTGNEIEKYLVLVSSGSCHFCDVNSSYWETLTHSLRPEDHVEVWMIKYDEPSAAPAKDDPLEGALKGRIPFKVFQVTDALLFSLKTGLVATPSTMLVDSRMIPELTYPGVMSAEILKTFEDQIRVGSTGSALFLPGSSVQPAFDSNKVSDQKKPHGSPARRLHERQSHSL